MKSSVKTAYFCSNCGYESLKWLGKCPSCEQWNTFIEEVIIKEQKEKQNHWRDPSKNDRISKSISINEISSSEEQRLVTSDMELNRVLGGGIVPGSIVLIAGEPGIGKSTLFLQNGLALRNVITLYISGEE